MSDLPPPSAAIPQTTDFLLAVFGELYQQEVAAEEDIHRTLPFFATALGIVVGALGYASGLMPHMPALTNLSALATFSLSTALLGLSAWDAGLVLYWLLQAVARREHLRIGPEVVLRATLNQRRAAHEANGTPPHQLDAELLNDMRQVLLENYCTVTPADREINRNRHLYRSRASRYLVKALMWALVATAVIFIAGKL
jgi:hypothetical protein